MLSQIVSNPNASEQDAFFAPSVLVVPGNKCGHVPGSPRLFAPPGTHKNRPDVILFAINNLARFYVKPFNWLKSLLNSRASSRQERSEARESDSAVGAVLLHYTELYSLNVGVPLANGKFINLDMKFIAKKVGWRTEEDDKEDEARIKSGKRPKNKGVKRVWRTIARFKKAGYLEVTAQREKREEAKEGESEYRGLPAVKKLDPKFFVELGIKRDRLEHRRKQAGKRVQKKRLSYVREIEQDIKKGITGAVGKLIDFVDPKGRKKRRRSFSATLKFENERTRQIKAMEIKRLPENCNLSAEAFYAKFPHLKSPNW